MSLLLQPRQTSRRTDTDGHVSCCCSRCWDFVYQLLLMSMPMSMPQILTFPEIMMFTDFAESGLVLKARPM
jgi:hypothetical protein